MSLFGTLKSDGLEESEDRLGANFGAVDSGVYLATIKMAYAGESTAGAKNLSLILDLDGHEYRETIYVTNRQGQNFYYAKDDLTKKKKLPLPGYTQIDDLALLTAEKPLSELDFQEKQVKIYDKEAKKEIPQAVPVAVELLGKQVYVAILKNLEDKTVKVEGTDPPEYVPNGETRETNNITKFFHAELRVTMVEARAGKEQGKFIDDWTEKNKDKVVNKVKGVTGGASAGRPSKGPSTPPKAGESAAPVQRKSLFGNKK